MKRMVAIVVLSLGISMGLAGVAQGAGGATFVEEEALSLTSEMREGQVRLVNTGDGPAVLWLHVTGESEVFRVSPARVEQVQPGGFADFTVTASGDASASGELLAVSDRGGPVARREVSLVVGAGTPPPPPRIEEHWNRGVPRWRSDIVLPWPEGGELPKEPLPVLSRTGGGLAKLRLDKERLVAEVNAAGVYEGTVLVGDKEVPLVLTARHVILVPLVLLGACLWLLGRFDDIKNISLPRAALRERAGRIRQQALDLQGRHADDQPRDIARISETELCLDRALDRALAHFETHRDAAGAEEQMAAAEALVWRFEDALLLRRDLGPAARPVWGAARVDAVVEEWHEEAVRLLKAKHGAQWSPEDTLAGTRQFHTAVGSGQQATEDWRTRSMEDLKEDLRRQTALVGRVGGVLALLVGLQELYFENPAFGSGADYLGVVTWGISLGAGVAVAKRLALRLPI